MTLYSKRPRKFIYSVNKKSQQTGRKVEKAVLAYKKLKQREAFEGRTLWIANAFAFVEAKLVRAGISINTL